MIDTKYLDAIKKFEGFTQRAQWDYAQSTNGYGTVAKFDGEIIDRTEAERRFQREINQAYEIVDRFAPDLDDGSKAALTSLTFNAGTTWTKSGLGLAIQSGDLSAARQIFELYNKAGGQELPGLTARRSAEVQWFGQSNPGATNIQVASASSTAAGIVSPARLDAYMTYANLPDRGRDSAVPGTLMFENSTSGTNGANVANLSPSSSGFTIANLLTLLSLGAWQPSSGEKSGDEGSSERAVKAATVQV